MSRVLILGMDGYLGWPLAMRLTSRGHEVAGVDRFFRRSWVTEMGSVSAMPIARHVDRMEAFKRRYGYEPKYWIIDVRDERKIADVLKEFKPSTIVHLAECPSAPYSMMNVGKARFVMDNNILGTLVLLHAMRDHAPQAHLLKLGTMGEYGTPNIDIPEGFFKIEYRGREDMLPFPRKAGSWYHWTKVHDSMNIWWACEIWRLSSTDIMQGVVYGTRSEEIKGHVPELRTRLDFDEAFGTAINRFVCQALIDHPITIYGDVGRQTRGFLPLRDSMQCFTLAIENPPMRGEYRVFNQFEETYSIAELADCVARVAKAHGINARVWNVEPPRMEAQEHYYNPDRKKLIDLGYEPELDMEAELATMFNDLKPHKKRIEEHRDVLIPEIRWSGKRERVKGIS